MDELLLVFCYFFQFPTLGTGTVCLFTFGTSAAVFLERAIQRIYQLLLSSIVSIIALFSLLFVSVQYFNNGVFIYVCCFDRLESLLNEMHFHDLNESYDSYEFARPGPSLMRCSFTKSNVVIFIKSITLTTCSYDSYESNPGFHDPNKWWVLDMTAWLTLRYTVYRDLDYLVSHPDVSIINK